MNTAKPLPESSPQTPFQVAAQSGFEPAGNNARVIAFIIDGLIAGVFGKILSVALFAPLKLHPLLVLLINPFIVTSLYWVGLTLQFGATPGKKLMGLRIVRADHDLDIGVGQMFFREIVGRIVSALPFCLGYVWVIFDKAERKTFHDRLAKTRVVTYR